MEKVSSDPTVVKFDLDDRIFDDMFRNPAVVSRLEKIGKTGLKKRGL